LFFTKYWMRYKEFKNLSESELNEIKMSPGNLRRLAAEIDAVAGMEFEMVFPDVDLDDGQGGDPDWDADEPLVYISSIEDFFGQGEYGDTRSARRAEARLQQDYNEDREGAASEAFQDVAADFIKAEIQSEYDEDDLIRLVLEDNFPSEKVDEIMQAGKDAPEFASREALKDYIEKNPNYAEYKEAESNTDSKLEELIQTSIDDQDESWDSAFESFLSDFDYDEEEWLRSKGFTLMSDIASEFDLGWPFRIERNDDQLIDLAGEFEAAIGRTTKYSTEYHGVSRDKNSYIVEPDSTISGSGAGLEFVSPPLRLYDMLEDLSEVVSWGKSKGAYTNKSTGLHINVSVPNYSLDKLDYIKLALLVGDRYVLEQFGRSANTYAKSAIDKIMTKVGGRADELPRLFDLMKQGMATFASQSIHSGFTDKYTSINTKSGYVEFRSPGGDWLNADIPKLENTLLRFVVALDAAVDPTKYKQEYLKKLYQLLAPKSENDPVAIFARYAAGELPQSALKSFIKQVQLQRNIKKQPDGGKKYWWEVMLNGVGQDGPGMEVVATSEQEALAIAAKTWEMTGAGMNRATARPIRPADMDIGQTGPRRSQPQSTAAGGTWTGRWLIKDNNGRILHSFSGIGNVQADANRHALEWLRRNGDPNVSAVVVPEMTQGE